MQWSKNCERSINPHSKFRVNFQHDKQCPNEPHCRKNESLVAHHNHLANRNNPNQHNFSNSDSRGRYYHYINSGWGRGYHSSGRGNQCLNSNNYNLCRGNSSSSGGRGYQDHNQNQIRGNSKIEANQDKKNIFVQPVKGTRGNQQGWGGNQQGVEMESEKVVHYNNIWRKNK